MTVSTKVEITTKNAFEQSVYAQFPTSLHKHVEHELYYNRYNLERGEMTMQEFEAGVLDTASWWDEQLAKRANDKVIFDGIQALIDQGTFEDASQVGELTHELEWGEESLLARFICFQPVKNSLDAAVSFLVWKHMKAIVELEEAFNVNLDHARSLKGCELYGTSESAMTLINFSVMSK